MSTSSSRHDNRVQTNSTLASLIQMMATLTINLHPIEGINRRIATCLAEDLSELMEGGDHYISMFRETLASTVGRLLLGGNAGPSLLDSSAALFELSQIIYSIPQAPQPSPQPQHQQHHPYHQQQQQRSPLISNSIHSPGSNSNYNQPPPPPRPTSRSSNYSPPPRGYTSVPPPPPASSINSRRFQQNQPSRSVSPLPNSHFLDPNSSHPPLNSNSNPTTSTSISQLSPINRGVGQAIPRPGGIISNGTAIGRHGSPQQQSQSLINRNQQAQVQIQNHMNGIPSGGRLISSSNENYNAVYSGSSGGGSTGRLIQPLVSSGSGSLQSSSVGGGRSNHREFPNLIQPLPIGKDYLTILPKDILISIIQFSQPPTYSNRLRHNLILSLVCKKIESIAKKKLRSEIHITKPNQLERLNELIQLDKDRFKEVLFLTIELNINDLRLKQPSSTTTASTSTSNTTIPTWFGSHFRVIISTLAPNCERISIALKDSANASGDRSAALISATGATLPLWEKFKKVKEMRLYFELTDSDMRSILKNPSEALRILYLDSVRKQSISPLNSTIRLKTPTASGSGNKKSIGQSNLSLKDEIDLTQDSESELDPISPILAYSEVTITTHPWKILSLPGVMLTTNALLFSLPRTGSTLRHLDCTLQLPTNDSELNSYLLLIKHLAPQLTYLSLQLTGIPSLESKTVNSYDSNTPLPNSIWKDLVMNLSNLIQVETLNLSCTYIHSTYTPSLLQSLSKLPKLRTLRLLSFLTTTRGPLDLSTDLVNVLAVPKDPKEKVRIPPLGYQSLTYLGVLLPRGRDRIAWEALELACHLKRVDLQVIG